MNTKIGLINFEGLKVAHEKFTWSGGEIPHIGTYGVHIWKNRGFWELDARVELILSTG